MKRRRQCDELFAMCSERLLTLKALTQLPEGSTFHCYTGHEATCRQLSVARRRN